MKRSDHIRKWVSRAGALAMLFVFVVISSVQAFHQHSSYTSEHDGIEVIHGVEQCYVCDYLLHKQVEHSPGLLNHTLAPVMLQPVQQTCFRETGICQTAFYIFTHRGPPAVSLS